MEGNVGGAAAAADDRRVNLPVGLATSIGSLPHYDPSEAVDFILHMQPRLPAAPTLPARSRREGMINQAAHGVAGITVTGLGTLEIDRSQLDPEAPLTDPGFSSDAYVGLRAFINGIANRRGPIKVSLTGPVTFGMALIHAGVEPQLAFRISDAAVRQRARALVQYVAQRVPQSELVAFLDEPSMGGAMHPEFPILPLDAVDLVSGSLAALEPLSITGLHCCGTADWRLLMQAGPQILSLPTDGGIEQAAGAFAGFLDRGGWVAWGAVPTDRPIGTTGERHGRMLQMLWCTLVTQGGCDPIRLRTQAMITPACGMWRHGISQAQQVLQFTNRLAERLHDQAIGVRLTVGA